MRKRYRESLYSHIKNTFWCLARRYTSRSPSLLSRIRRRSLRGFVKRQAYDEEMRRLKAETPIVEVKPIRAVK